LDELDLILRGKVIMRPNAPAIRAMTWQVFSFQACARLDFQVSSQLFTGHSLPISPWPSFGMGTSIRLGKLMRMHNSRPKFVCHSAKAKQPGPSRDPAVVDSFAGV
jgi:hypothetical protein